MTTPDLARRALALPRDRFDLSRPLFILLALILCGLVLLPLGWLAWFGTTDKAGSPTFANFSRLVSDWSFAGPFVTTLGIAIGVALASCVVATPLAWLVARTDMPFHR